MEIRFWGTRGSIPSPGPLTLEFGGNTTCLEVVLKSGRRIVIDAGTGIRLLGDHLRTSVATVRLHLLFTHNHWDHLLGLPFFAPIYRSDSEILMDGWPQAFTALRKVFDDHMGDGFFPVAFDQLKAHTSFLKQVARAPLVIDNAIIDSIPLNHPQGCLGFRFREGNHCVVFITDNELGLENGYRFAEFVKFAHKADILIHDAQYLPEEMPAHHGWGHSTYEESVHLALEAGAKYLLLTHHDPSRTDDQVRDIVRRARELAASRKNILRIDGAREGAVFSLPEKQARPAPRLAAAPREKSS